MVALAVRYFGQRPMVCQARPMLLAAQASLQRGDLIDAGCRLREAARLYLHALCEYHDRWPRHEHDRKKPTCLAKTLRRARILDPGVYKWVMEATEIGNQLAHCVPVKPSLISTAIWLMGLVIGHSPELEQPAAGGQS